MYRSRLHSEHLPERRVSGFVPAKRDGIAAVPRYSLRHAACLAKSVLLLLFAMSHAAFAAAGPGPELSLTKKVVDRTKKYAPGDIIQYEIRVTNTGDVALTHVVVTDTTADSPNTWPIDTLAPGASSPAFMAYHTVTPADLEKGRVDNIAEVSAEDPNGDPVTAKSTDPDCPDCPFTGVPVDPGDSHGLVVTKTADRSKEYTKVGDVIRYGFRIENTSTDPIRDVVLTDKNADGDKKSVEYGSVLPGVLQHWNISHTVTQEEVDRGYVYNIGLVTAETNDGKPFRVRSKDGDPCPDCTVDPGCPDCTVVPIIQKTEITLVKDAKKPEDPRNVGDTIYYEITVKNTGEVTVYDISVTDNNADNRLVGERDTLPAGESHLFTAYHTVTQQDVDDEFVLNLALAEGKTAKGKPVTAESTSTQPPPKDAPLDNCPTCTVVKIWQEEPELSLLKDLKDPEKSYYRPGDTIYYEITVRNTGNVDLKNIVVTDTLADWVGVQPGLPVGQGHSWAEGIFHTVTQDDLDRGYVLNIALVEGKTDPNGDVVTAESTSSIPLDGDPIDPNCPTCTVLEFSAAEAIEDLFEVTWLADRAVRGSVLDNDKLNKKPVDPSEVILTPLSPTNPGLWMDRRTGTIAIDPVVVPGTYEYPYYFCEVLNPENCSQAKAVIVVLPNDKMSVFVPNIFTPNGDGVNDAFEILEVEKFDRADVVIINRWGNEVYHSSEYRNDRPWTGETLNPGVYYYIVTLHKGGKTEVVNGTVLLAR